MSDDFADRVKKAIVDAAAMAQGLPESLQAAAFGKAFDALISTDSDRSRPNGQGLIRETTPSSKPRRRAQTESETPAQTDAVKTLVNKLNRTEHPEIRMDRTAGDLALLVLRAAREKCGIEWLTPAEISAVLRSKFRLKVAPPAVRMRLGDSKFVDRKDLTGTGKKYAYSLMAAGDAYLDKLPAVDKPGK